MKKLIAIYGPTTSNKLGLSLNLAKYIFGKYHINTEIVNVDSRKIYKGFKISQHLLKDDQKGHIPSHLFGIVSPRRMLDIFEFRKLIMEKVSKINKRNSLPILVGGSPLHIRSVLENWVKGKVNKKTHIPRNYLVLGTKIPKKTLKKALCKHVNEMFKSGLYEEFKTLYRMYKKGLVSYRLLNETHGYRQFIEMARVCKINTLLIHPHSMKKVKLWMIKDLLNFGYKQILDYKRFKNIKLIDKFSQARKYVDRFLADGHND